MDLDAYVISARRTINPALDERDRTLDAAAGLAEEAAEVLGLVRKRAFQNRDVSRERLVEELGDVLWCLAITADSLGVSLDEVAKANVEKLQARHPDGFAARGPEEWSRSLKE
ncbi:MAG TPA: MazG nucleotide pyrophosphohydrolase domain-containing protein [Gemmatimonadaceae bacterium]|jgi:NTP pyrophosphatase (non-canonical NTP hydrolase)|nr:MazG nucleotide pyrophosphohydrolase domain-containing protein [Gemmatimonadaceae bacterium]